MTGRVVIAGGTGAIGTALADHWATAGCEVVLLSRKAVESPHKTVVWDARSGGPWTECLEGAVAVVNLCGSPINRPWTKLYREVLLSSRTEPTRALASAIRLSKSPPAVWINANATGIYGDTGDRQVSESARPGTDFLGRMAKAWSDAFWETPLVGTKRIEARFGVVLGSQGALPLLTRLTRLFLGAPAGTGRQFVSWIHIHDLCRLADFAVESLPGGVFNFTSPNPVQNRALMDALANLVGRPHLPPVPIPLFRLAARLAGTQPDIVLQGQRAIPVLALANGFEFRHPTLAGALADLGVA